MFFYNTNAATSGHSDAIQPVSCRGKLVTYVQPEKDYTFAFTYADGKKYVMNVKVVLSENDKAAIAFQNALDLPENVTSAVEAVIENGVTTYNVTLGGTAADKAVPDSITSFADTFTTSSFKADADSVAAINLTGFIPNVAAKTYTIVQKNNAMSVYEDEKLQDNITKDELGNYTKTKEGYVHGADGNYEVMIMQGKNITVTLKDGTTDVAIVNVTNNVAIAPAIAD